MSYRTLRCNLAFALLWTSAPALAGPPLSLDDPGILEPGQWEIISAVTIVSSDAGDACEVPLLDVSLGVLDDYVQISAAYPYVHNEPDGEGSESEFGNLTIGVKWRFVNAGRWQVAFAPGYLFGTTRKAAEKGIGEDTDILVLPVNAEYELSDGWRLNGEVGYASVEDGGDEWGYAAALAHDLDERATLLFELSGAVDTEFGGHTLDVRAGIDFGVTENFHLLFSMATGVREPSGEDGLDYDAFLGLQLLR